MLTFLRIGPLIVQLDRITVVNLAAQDANGVKGVSIRFDDADNWHFFADTTPIAARLRHEFTRNEIHDGRGGYAAQVVDWTPPASR